MAFKSVDAAKILVFSLLLFLAPCASDICNDAQCGDGEEALEDDIMLMQNYIISSRSQGAEIISRSSGSAAPATATVEASGAVDLAASPVEAAPAAMEDELELMQSFVMNSRSQDNATNEAASSTAQATSNGKGAEATARRDAGVASSKAAVAAASNEIAAKASSAAAASASQAAASSALNTAAATASDPAVAKAAVSDAKAVSAPPKPAAVSLVANSDSQVAAASADAAAATASASADHASMRARGGPRPGADAVSSPSVVDTVAASAAGVGLREEMAKEENLAAKAALEELVLGHKTWREGPHVSTAMKCVSALAVQYFSVYVLLNLRRTISQLYSAPESIEQKLLHRTAELTTNLLPMIGVLFLAVEMLAGELSRMSEALYGLPPWWADIAMVVAVATGVAVMFLFLFQEACFPSDDSGSSNSTASPDASPGSCAKFCTWISFAATILQYAAVAVVIVAALAMQVPYDVWLTGADLGMSPAVRCVIILTIQYFAINLFSNFSNTFDKHTGRPSPSAASRAAEAAAKTQNLAPMLGILFLATRMRATQMGRENDWWQCQVFLYICTYALLAKTLCCLPLICLSEGQFSKDNGVTMTEYAYQVVQCIAELVVYVGMIAIVFWIVLLQAPGGWDSTPPLSPTLTVLVVMSIQFFGIYLFLFVSETADSLLGKSADGADQGGMMESTNRSAVAILRAATDSVMFCPMIAVLFVGTRMWALQLSKYEGHPQPWVQDCMYGVMTASLVQLGLVIATGVLAGEPVEDLSRKNPTFKQDERSGIVFDMTLVVIILQYLALAALIGGSVAVLVGLFLATPANTAP